MGKVVHTGKTHLDKVLPSSKRNEGSLVMASQNFTIEQALEAAIESIKQTKFSEAIKFVNAVLAMSPNTPIACAYAVLLFLTKTGLTLPLVVSDGSSI